MPKKKKKKKGISWLCPASSLIMLESIKFSESHPMSWSSEHEKCVRICRKFDFLFSEVNVWIEKESQEGQPGNVSSKHAMFLLSAWEACLSLTQTDKVIFKGSWYWALLLHLYWSFRSQEMEEVRKYKMYEKYLHFINGRVIMTTDYVNILCYNPVSAMIHWFITKSNSSMCRALASPEPNPPQQAFVF